MSKIYCIIATYNSALFIRACLASLAGSRKSLAIVVVDNASTDETVEIICKEYSFVHLIKNQENVGFGPANNQGIAFALEQGAEYLFLLNADCRVTPDCLEKLWTAAQKLPDAGAVSPFHWNGAGTMLDVGFYLYFCQYCQYCRAAISALLAGKSLEDVYQIEFVNAAALLIPRSVLEKVGDLIRFMHPPMVKILIWQTA